jgi:hypothetical protein
MLQNLLAFEVHKLNIDTKDIISEITIQSKGSFWCCISLLL